LRWIYNAETCVLHSNVVFHVPNHYYLFLKHAHAFHTTEHGLQNYYIIGVIIITL